MAVLLLARDGKRLDRRGSSGWLFASRSSLLALHRARSARTMDLARFQLDKAIYASDREFREAAKKKPLLPDPVLAIAR
jgi:hypothetical protein